MDCMSDSTEFQEINSICSQPAVVLSPLWDAEPRPKSATWYMENDWYIGETFFGNPCVVIDSSSTHYQGMLHSGT